MRDEDQFVWEKAKDIIGESLSAYLTNHLRTVISMHEAAMHGNDRILLSFRQEGIPRTKAFNGRWLIPPAQPFECEEYDTNVRGLLSANTIRYGVAATAKNRIVIFKFGERKHDGTFTWGYLWVFDSFEDANSSPNIPSGLIGTAMEIMGVPVEELDI